jgi:ABC-type branched-subunit amino acid transport system ATPase component
VIRPSTQKHRVDLDAAAQNRKVFAELPAREAAELPVRRRRRTRRAQQAYDAFRDLLEGGR